MTLHSFFRAILVSSSLFSLSSALAPRDVQGTTHLSPLAGQTVTNLTGIVTAKAASAFYLQSKTSDDNNATSEAVYVYGSAANNLVAVGDEITLSGTVTEYRSSSQPSYMHLTEITSPTSVVVLSQGNVVKPIVLGVDRTPPTERTFFDNSFGLPNNTTNAESEPSLDPSARGLDFWESLEGMLVTIPNPNAVSVTNSYDEVWVVGRDYATGLNARGGVTSRLNEDTGVYDLNPEAIWIWSALDGTAHPKDLLVGTQLADITGVISYSFGYYILYPTTAVSAKSPPSTTPPTASLTSKSCESLLIGTYNVENLSPTDARVAEHANIIVTQLGQPDILALQEVQDGDGSTNSGTVSGAATLDAIVTAIQAGGGVTYNWTEIDPVDGLDGGIPGGNIRQAFLYRTDKVSLTPGAPAGGPNDTQSIVYDSSTNTAQLALNPGRIDPTNAAWDFSRKPLTVSFTLVGCEGAGDLIFINLHLASKSGSSSPQGVYQNFVNGAVAQRVAQANVIKDFVNAVFEKQSDAKVVLLGDLNEFTNVEPLNIISSTLTEVLVADPVERYSYQFDSSCQQLDHIFVSKSLLPGIQSEHVHVNTWRLEADAASDHDPYLALLSLGGQNQGRQARRRL